MLDLIHDRTIVDQNTNLDGDRVVEVVEEASSRRKEMPRNFFNMAKM